ncbi:MAG: hypothetical protein V1847_00995 [Candidatus Diapherotrites archaeon]
MEPPCKVALDSNMLMAIAQFHVNIWEEIEGQMGKVEFGMPEQVREELERLQKSKKTALAAQIALQQAAEKAKLVKAEGKSADSALQKLAKKGYTIATNDRALRKKIKSKCLVLRHKRLIRLC